MSKPAFLEWAAKAAISGSDPAPLGEMIGDATLVALGEAVHGAAEPLEFRNRLLQYLVEEKDFTAIALESGIVEGRAVHDYVRGNGGDVDTVLARGLSWNFDRLPQNRDLIAWLKSYNTDPKHTRKVSFYGFDVPGSPGETTAKRGVDTALTATLEYLERVDPNATAKYCKLTPAQRVAWLDRHQTEYTAASSVDDYSWACRTAIGAQQVDTWLRQMPSLGEANDIRDRAQADNLEWIVDREGPEGKILIFAHRYHTSTAPVYVSWTGRLHEVMGSYLRRRFGKQLVTIGNLIGRGEVDCDAVRQTLGPPPPDSIEALAPDLKLRGCLLDLRKAPPAIADWLTREQALGHGSDVLKLSLASAFDILFCLDTVTPAC